MNKKGQSLVLFIALLPIVIMLFAFVFDNALISIEKRKLNTIANSSIDYMEKGISIDNISKYVKDNDENIKIKKIDKDDKEIELEVVIDSYFGKILGFNNYRINSNIKK